MHCDTAAPAASRVLDTLYRQLRGSADGAAPPSPRSRGRLAALTSARIFVLDECAQDWIFPIHAASNTTEGPLVKKTLLALDRIKDRLENELDATSGHTEREAGYRAGISEALVQVMDIRQDLGR
ncbi:hypothetical protein [Rhodococcus sp. NPDC003348]